MRADDITCACFMFSLVNDLKTVAFDVYRHGFMLCWQLIWNITLSTCLCFLQAGFKNIVHVDGGFPQWRYDQLPTETD